MIATKINFSRIPLHAQYLVSPRKLEQANFEASLVRYLSLRQKKEDKKVERRG